MGPKRRRNRKRKRQQKRLLKVKQINAAEVSEIIEKLNPTDEDRELLLGIVDTLLFLTDELDQKRVSIKRLKQILFGIGSEKTGALADRLGAGEDADEDADNSAENDTDKDNKAEGNAGESDDDQAKKSNPKGHGRNGAEAYTGAELIEVQHESLHSKDSCPDCHQGKVYVCQAPGVLIRLRGQAPVNGEVYNLQKLRCNLCGKVFTAAAPEGIGEEKYDATSGSIIAMMKYGTGMPFSRLERLQENLGIPLPASTQWEIVEELADKFEPVLDKLAFLAGQGEVLHNDDTTMKIMELLQERKQGLVTSAQDDPEGITPERTGIFTSGVVSLYNNHKIAVFFTGRSHAGENLAKLLRQRADGLDPPIQMCDALSRNLPKDLKTIVANCIAHGRRKFVDVADNFPDECLHVLGLLREVYKNDAIAREQAMTPEERLRFHQQNSAKLIQKLKDWCKEQLDQHLTEPNSGLGEAITYMLKHWDKLTLFLRVPGAPLDNNICERALKKAILHRKNAYYYKTRNGARVGDLFMSMIYTCELNQANPFDYLTKLQEHLQQAIEAPEQWMPWNYRERMNHAK